MEKRDERGEVDGERKEEKIKKERSERQGWRERERKRESFSTLFTIMDIHIMWNEN